ncbi:DUF1573 domain-containing protein [Aurantibacter sp.]|uniref:DUF1573 domain-containing protein n=1 Tax=Aurantibacter sp. TaxID=2807103 RepID=UPI0035C86529
MKKIYIILITVVILIVIGISTYKENKFYNVYGKAEIPVTEYDFGIITYLDTINYTFKIKNIGKEPLIINKVIPNCNCTVVDLKKGLVETNDITEIVTQFIPNKTRLGENSASILVEGNFNGGITHLKLKGIVNDIE